MFGQRAVGPEEAVGLVLGGGEVGGVLRTVDWVRRARRPGRSYVRSRLSSTKMSMSSPAMIGPNVITNWSATARVASAWRCDATVSTMSSPASALITIRRVRIGLPSVNVPFGVRRSGSLTGSNGWPSSV